MSDYASLEQLIGARPSETNITVRIGAAKGLKLRIRSLSGRNLDTWTEMADENDPNAVYFLICASLVSPAVSPDDYAAKFEELAEMDAYSRGDIMSQIYEFNGVIKKGQEVSEEDANFRGEAASTPAAA